jgi:serine/threonine-protein kinase
MLEPRVSTTVFGRYLLQKALAKGAMGAVWIARDKRLERDVAVKTLKANFADSPDAMARFEREAMAVAKLNSPYIVQIFDYGIDNKCPFIVMELMKGEDLDTRLKKHKRIGVWDLIPIVVQTAKALTVAHQAGIVHRDLKPGNLFLVKSEEEEIVKVLDFGVAKATLDTGPDGEAQDQEATKAGTLLGTPVFMSPEQARGVKDIDQRADLWSLGVIIFRALTGKLPFVGTSITDTIVKICTAQVPKATTVAPDLPAEVDKFFARALARNPTARFNTARELATAFARIAPRQSYPSMTLPGLPQDVQQEILEAGLGSSAGYTSQPGLTSSAAPLKEEVTADGITKKKPLSPRIVADVGSGQPLIGQAGLSPFAPSPSVRHPNVGPSLRSEAVTLRPRPPVFEDDDDDDDDEDDMVTNLYQGVQGPDGKFRLPGTEGSPVGDGAAQGLAPAGLPGLVDDETTTDRAAGVPRPGATDSQVRGAIKPPPLPGAAIVEVEGSMEPVDPLSTKDGADGEPPLSGGLFDTGGAELRQSHGTLGSQAQALDAPPEAAIPKKSNRLVMILGAAAGALAIAVGGIAVLSSGDEPTAEPTPAATNTAQAVAMTTTATATAEVTEPPEPETTAEPDATAAPTAEATAEATAEPTAVPTSEPTAAPTTAPPKPPVTDAKPKPPRPPRPPKPKPPPPPDEDTYDSRY